MPPLATSNRPFLRRDGRGECALDVAEERGLQQLGRHGAGVDRHKWLVAARRVGVDGLGDQLLAGAAFALDEDGGAAGATCATRSKTRSMVSLLPTMFAKL